MRRVAEWIAAIIVVAFVAVVIYGIATDCGETDFYTDCRGDKTAWPFDKKY